MNIWVDQNIPFAEEIFGSFGKLTFFEGREFSIEAAQASGVEVLITRSVTKITRDIAKIKSLRFVGTTTIGTDHVDVEALARNRVTFAHAPGSNAQSVAEYVICAMAALGYLRRIVETEMTVGVVGYGHVGRRVTQLLTGLGVHVHVYDPFVLVSPAALVRQVQSLEDIMCLPVVTVHVPLTHSGPHPTVDMFTARKLELMPKTGLFINTARGAITPAADLEQVMTSGERAWVLDVWPEEPFLPKALVQWMVNHRHLAIGTPHIAGHSVDGKVGGALMVAQALAKFLRQTWHAPKLQLPSGQCFADSGIEPPAVALEKILTEVYPIRRQSDALLTSTDNIEKRFDAIRGNLQPRREFRFHRVTTKRSQLATWLRAFGFEVEPA